MSDIYDEYEAIKSTKEIVTKLRLRYERYLSPYQDEDSKDTLDPDVRRRRTKLAMRFPDEESVRQLIMDVIDIMHKYELSPTDIKW